MEIKRLSETEKIDEFINKEFTDYAIDCNVALNFEEFCFVAEDDGKIAGVITGRAYYNEVHIGDLIVTKEVSLWEDEDNIQKYRFSMSRIAG